MSITSPTGPDPDLRERQSSQDRKPVGQGAPLVQQFSWMSRFGPMLIEVRADAIYVNGQRVEQAPPNP